MIFGVPESARKPAVLRIEPALGPVFRGGHCLEADMAQKLFIGLGGDGQHKFLTRRGLQGELPGRFLVMCADTADSDVSGLRGAGIDKARRPVARGLLGVLFSLARRRFGLRGCFL